MKHSALDAPACRDRLRLKPIGRHTQGAVVLQGIPAAIRHLGSQQCHLQLMVLGVLLARLALIFHSLLSVCAGRLHGRLRAGMISRRLGAYGFAVVMTALAARLLVLNRPVQGGRIDIAQ